MTGEVTDDNLVRLRRALTSVNGVPFTSGNRVDALRNGDEIFPAMLAAIEAAERSIDFLTFVYWSGTISTQFGDALSRAAGRGVRVRALLDGVGAKPVDGTLVEGMRQAGVDVRWFRPPSPLHPLQANHRTHRKVLVCDERVAFTGGVGIADEWTGDGHTDGGWRDTHVRIEGPAADGLRAAFLDNWIETGSQLFDPDVDHFPEQPSVGESEVQVVTGTAEPGWNAISMTIRAAIDLAAHDIKITTAYFVPDDDLTERLLAAAGRGVEIDLLVPGPEADKRFVQLAGERRYRVLLDGGVRIWAYQPSMLHAKILTIDGSVSVIGSANFNHRSTSLDEEVNLIVVDDDFTGGLNRDFDVDRGRSVELDLSRWRRRSLPQRVLERVMHTVRPFM